MVSGAVARIEWSRDLELMQQARMNVVRMAEFCMEPHGAAKAPTTWLA